METIIEEGVEKKESENKWFVLRVLSGKERKIKDYLDKESNIQVKNMRICQQR